MFFRQFETFDPRLDTVPDYPFSILPQIAERARYLLRSRTTEQINYAASGIDWAINEYFRTVREEEIQRLWTLLVLPNHDDEGWDIQKAYELFEWEYTSNDGDGFWSSKSNQDDVELSIPTAETTSEVDAFKVCIDWWDNISGDGLPDEKPYELFAVLSLWLLADAMKWLGLDSVDENIDQAMAALDAAMRQMGVKTVATNINMSLAGGCALNAMDAVCYAEHLKEITKIHDDYLNKQVVHQC
jgi:hypothetical protein